MVQHLLHFQRPVTPKICYNKRVFEETASPLVSSETGVRIPHPPPRLKVVEVAATNIGFTNGVVSDVYEFN